MLALNKIPLGDPSKIEQAFPKTSLEIWCCRYWMLREWECNETVFPYWRIYWNRNDGGIIVYRGKTIRMKHKNAYIILPNTFFQSHISGSKRKLKGMNVVGREVRSGDNEEKLSSGHLFHLFIHFNLGVPYDYVDPNLLEIQLDEKQIDQLEKLTFLLKQEATYLKRPQEFKMGQNLLFQSVIFDLLSCLHEKIWDTMGLDNRVSDVIHLIENNIHRNFSNTELAQECHMATNSLNRLFKEEKGIALQQYIRQRKIARAHTLLEHTRYSIETIAELLGFANRYHFSRIFKQVTASTPAQTRKESILKVAHLS